MKILNTISYVSLLLLLSGCETTNPYSTYYIPSDIPDEAKSQLIYLVEGEEPKIYSEKYDDLEKINLRAAKAGYINVGYSSFYGPSQHHSLAIEQGKKIGATLIVISSKYTGEVKYQKKVTLPSSSSTNTNTNTNYYSTGNTNYNLYSTNPYLNNIYGNAYTNNNTSAYGSNSSTTYNYETKLVDAQYSKYDQYASYWVKHTQDIKDLKLGVRFGVTPENIKKEVKTNSGLYVLLVFDNTPAYRGDLFDGDLILEVNDKKIYSQEFLDELSSGEVVQLKIYRDGEYIMKNITLN